MANDALDEWLERGDPIPPWDPYQHKVVGNGRGPGNHLKARWEWEDRNSGILEKDDLLDW